MSITRQLGISRLTVKKYLQNPKKSRVNHTKRKLYPIVAKI
jgi:biotin operon repressor